MYVPRYHDMQISTNAEENSHPYSYTLSEHNTQTTIHPPTHPPHYDTMHLITPYHQPGVSHILHALVHAAEHAHHQGGVVVAIVRQGDDLLEVELTVEVEGELVAAQDDGIATPFATNEAYGNDLTIQPAPVPEHTYTHTHTHTHTHILIHYV